MASKGPKKKESKDQVPSTTKELSQSSNTSQVNDDKTSAKKKSPIPLWPEWTDQEIANEKWDLAKKEKERGRSPNAAAHYFDDPEGLIDLPITLKTKVHAWKRPVDIIPDEIVPVVIEPSNTSCSQLDILTPNEHIICSEVICSIVSSITTLHQFFMPNRDSPAFCPSKFKTNLNIKEPPKDSKADRGAGKKDGDVAAAEELPWKPWDLIWPKESTKPGSMPLMNSSGKYVVKLYWMGCYRKITIDDTIPCDVDMKPLLPFTTNGNELWPMILAKALIKVASLDYFGGREGSEMGEVNFIHCLTGWMPELIPLDGVYSDKIWKLLLQVLPNWKLPQPPSQQTEEVNTTNVTANTSLDVKTLQSLTENQNLGTSKLELNTKESTYKNKKDEKSKDESTKKSKTNDKDPKTTKEKLQTPNVALKQSNLSQHLIFASFKGSPIISNMNSTTINKDFADLKRDSAASSKLREFGLIRSLPHPVHVSVARNCPLIPPPTPVQIPRWKLIRQKKKVETSEPSLHPKEYKEPKFVELKTPFLNFKVRPTPVSSANLIGSRSTSHTPMASLTEEIMNKDGTIDLPQEQIPTQPNVSSDSTKDMTETKDQHQNLDASSNSDVKSERKLSFESQSGTAVTVAPPKSPRHSKSRIAVSSKEAKKSILKERSKSIVDSNINSTNQDTASNKLDQSQTSNGIPPTTTPIEVPEDSVTSGNTHGIELNEPESDELKKLSESNKEIWMELDDFFECFNFLWIFHRPKQYNKNVIDLKNFEAKNERGKKSSGHNLVTAGRSALLSPTSFLYGGNASSDTPPPYILIDCLKEVELMITLQSFSRWFDPNLSINYVKDGQIDKDILSQVPKPVSGSLVIEPYSWKKVAASSPLLKIRTTGVKAVALTLPPGRHVLRLMVTAPLGFNVHLSSLHPFHYGDENIIMQELKNESQRFIEHSMEVVQQIANVMQTFISPANCNPTKLLLGTETKSNQTRLEHFEALFESFGAIMKKELGSNYNQQATKFALEALKHQAYFHLMKFHKRSTKRPTSLPALSATQQTFTRDDCSFKRTSLPSIHFKLKNNHRDKAAAMFQALFRGFVVRKLKQACTPGSAENVSCVEQLTKVLQLVTSNCEQISISTYRHMFTMKPSLFQLFPFHSDDWNKISYMDYTGTYPEQQADSWFVVCRDIFYVEESFLVLPKFYCNVPGCHLIVINNDTCCRVKTVFKRVVPQVLQKNKTGYTFVVTAYTENVVPAGKFKLRLIGERNPLPGSSKEGTINSSFFVNETRDYYIPNKYDRIFRHSVSTTEDVLSSIQFTTSKDEAHVKIQVLDQGEVVYESVGKKYVTIPALIFYKNVVQGEEKSKSRPTSRTGSGRSSGKQSSTNKRPNSSSRKSASPEKNKSKILEPKIPETIEETKIHKYVIQGFVLKDSWPLTKKQWDFIENPKNFEDEDQSVESKPDNSSKGSAGKTRGSKSNSKDKGVRSRPESQTQNLFDITQAHWTLKVVVDSNMESAITIKRDTEREDEIKAIKNAWETHQPGRAAKALQSRAKYLESHTVAREPETNETEATEGNVGDLNKDKETKETRDRESIKTEGGEDSKNETTEIEVTPSTPSLTEVESCTLYNTRPPKDTDPILKQFDLTPFLRSSGKPVLLDATKEEEIRAELEQRFHKYHEFREKVLALREEDRVSRNNAKERQIEVYEDMQMELDKARGTIYKAREAYRVQFLPKSTIENPPEVADVETDKKKRTPSPKRKPSKASRTPSKAKKK